MTTIDVSAISAISAILSTLAASVAIADRSVGGRIEVLGNDRLRFLHNQTTNTIQFRKPGQGCETVFVTSTARTIDLARVYLLEDRALLLLSPQRYQFLLTWLDRYIFPADQVCLRDVTPDTACIQVLGKRSSELLGALGLRDLPQTIHEHGAGTVADIPVRVAMGSGLTYPGYTLILAADQAESLRQALIHSSLDSLVPVVLNDSEWEMLRILDGYPAPDAELTEDYNPLEAGLWHTLAFDKGCYIGQETIARLNTYKGVKQRLWGIQFAESVEVGAMLNEAGEKVGTLTSLTASASGYFGLGYLRTKAGGIGSIVRVGEKQVQGTIVAAPYLHHPD